MKISYSNYPVLKKLTEGSIGNVGIAPSDYFVMRKIASRISKEFKENVSAFKSEINVIRKPFMEACENSRDKLTGLMQEIQIKDISDFIVMGTYIINNVIVMINYETKQHDENVKIVFFLFSKQGDLLAYHSMDRDIDEVLWISSVLKVSTDEESIRSWMGSHVGWALILKMFKTYADVETKILKPKTKFKDIDCKYLNDTDFNLTYLDSKWYTNLVKSEGFKVRGHFRLQPFGIGLKERKLVWINEFDKSGYTAKAKIYSA